MAHTRCSWGVLSTLQGVLATGAEQGMHGHTERGVLGTETPGVLAVFWVRIRCSGGVLGTAEVFWAQQRCSGHTSRCSGGVLDAQLGVLDSRRTWEIGHQRDKPRGVRILYVRIGFGAGEP